MRRPLAAATLSIPILLTGCTDQAASDRARAREQLAQALDQVNAAQRGWVPSREEKETADGGHVADLGAYRQRELQKAVSTLSQALSNPQLDDASRASAQRIVGDAFAEAARFDTRNAMNQAASLSGRTTTLVAKLMALDNAAARAVSTKVDEAPLLAKLADARKSTNANIAAITQELGKLRKDIAGFADGIKTRQAAGQAAQKNSQKLRQDAFIATGDAQFNLYNQATEAERTADKANADAQKQIVRLDVLKSEETILVRQLELAKDTIKSIDEQTKAAKEREEEYKALNAKAIADRDAALTDLKKELAEVTAGYEAIDKGFTSAGAFALQSVQAIEAASKRAGSGAMGRTLKAELLSKRTVRSYVLTHHAAALGGFVKTFQLLADQSNRLAPGTPDFEAAVKSYKEMQDRVATEASSVIDEAVGLHSELIQNAKDAEADDLDNLKNQLLSYRGRLASSRGEGPVPPPTKVIGGPAPAAPAEGATEGAAGTGESTEAPADATAAPAAPATTETPKAETPPPTD